MHTDYYLQCVLCRKKTSEKETTSRCLSCGGPLEVLFDYELLKQTLNTYLLSNTTPKAMKYLDFYPLMKRNELYTLNEGGTPFHSADRLKKNIGIKNLYIKNEGMNPTGVFKDRGSFVEINKAKEMGFKSVGVASTGNMAASVAAYAAQAGMECFVFIPENTPRGKLAQSLSYGAKVIQVRGTYDDANALCEKAAQKYNFYLAGDYVFRAEGQKSIGFEVAEFMWKNPVDWLIIPVGMGTNFSAIWKGLWEYQQVGLIEKLPRLVAVQAEGCNPIKQNGGEYSIEPVKKPQTVCSAIAIGTPLDGPKVIRALKQSHGLATSVPDDATLAAQLMLANTEALYIEPSSATSIAVLQKLLAAGTIKPEESVVCVATGIGLKDPATTLKVLAEPPTIEPDLGEVERVISTKLFAIRAGAVKDKEKTIFEKVPTKEELTDVIQKEFSVELSAENLEEALEDIREFIEDKGKHIGKADMQAILEEVIQQRSRKNYLVLTDYEIHAGKKKRPHASVEVELNGQTYKDEAEGVGPVDAAIHAIQKVVTAHDGIDFKLTDFVVEIPTTGSDSTVKVTMVLQEKGGTQVVEKGTSPDIIVASMNAFVKGYNELVYQLKERK